MNTYAAGSFCRCRDFSISSEPPRSNCNTGRQNEEGLTCLWGRKRQEMMKRTSPGRRSGSSSRPPAAGPPWTSMRQQIITVSPTTLYALHPEFCCFVPAASFQIEVNISDGTMSNVGEFWCSCSNGLSGACSHLLNVCLQKRPNSTLIVTMLVSLSIYLSIRQTKISSLHVGIVAYIGY